MKNLFDLGNQYAGESDRKDFAYEQTAVEIRYA